MNPYFSFADNETECRQRFEKMLKERDVDLSQDIALHNALDSYLKAYYGYQAYRMKLVEDSRKQKSI